MCILAVQRGNLCIWYKRFMSIVFVGVSSEPRGGLIFFFAISSIKHKTQNLLRFQANSVCSVPFHSIHSWTFINLKREIICSFTVNEPSKECMTTQKKWHIKVIRRTVCILMKLQLLEIWNGMARLKWTTHLIMKYSEKAVPKISNAQTVDSV